jgi:Ser/Thr protein kinase RdoA (MazF antagonist)
LISKLDGIRNQLEQLPVRNDNFGLIHHDFEPDNLVWNGRQVSIVDFDDCANYWFAADIAFALRDAFGDSPGGVDLGNGTVQQFLRGYRLERDIENIELQRIPLFLALHNLVTMARLQDALAPEASGDEPEWLVALRKKLEAKIDFYRAQMAEFKVA